MKKEIVVVSTITTLLSMLNATEGLNIKELQVDNTGKIIVAKDIKEGIDKNKKIGKNGNDKLNICLNSCIKAKDPKMKTPKGINEMPIGVDKVPKIKQ